jgi:hypothetical protein
MQGLMRLFLLIVLILCISLTSFIDVNAQERVMTLDGYPITIRYLEKDEKVADKVSAVAADAIPRLSRELGLHELKPLRVFLISDMEAFQKEIQVRLPSWGVAFALMDNRVMLVDVKRATHAMNKLDNVIPHELSHLLVAQRVGGVGLPVWFVEGLAMWQAREWSLVENWRLMEAVWGHRAPTLNQVYVGLPREEPRARDAYRVAYVGFTERFDGQMDRIPGFLDEVVRSGDFSSAFEVFWGENEFDYYTRFAVLLNSRYRSRLLLFQTGPLFTIMAVLFLFVVLRIYIRNRNKLKRMEDVDRGSWPEDS